MSAYIRVRKATDNKFFSLDVDTIKGVEDGAVVLKDGEEPVDGVIIHTVFGTIPVSDSSNRVMKLLQDAGASWSN